MSTAKQFKEQIECMTRDCGINIDNLFFSQTRDNYSITYKKDYPQHSNSDFIVQMWAKEYGGDYEFIHFGHGKFHSHYFKSIDDLIEYVKERV